MRAMTLLLCAVGCGIDVGAPTAQESTDSAALSPYLPSHASGVLMRVINRGDWSSAFNLRPTGVAGDSNVYSDVQTGCQVQAIGPLDAEHRIDLLAEDPTFPTIFVEGYLTDNAVFFPYPQPKVTFTTAYQWKRISLAGVPGMPADAKFAIVEVDGPGTRPPRNNYSFRYPGAADNRIESHSSGHAWSVVPLNERLELEAYFTDVSYCYLNIVGAIRGGQVRTSGGANLSPATRDGTWQTVDLAPLAPPADARWAVIELFSPTASITHGYSVRPHGAPDFAAPELGNRDIAGLQLFPLHEGKFDIRLEPGSTTQLYCWGFVGGDGAWNVPVEIAASQMPGGPQFTTVDMDELLAHLAPEEPPVADPDPPADSVAPVVQLLSVTLRGTAADASGIASLTVGGTAVPVAADGSWQHTVALEPLTTTVQIVATDPLGNTSSSAVAISR